MATHQLEIDQAGACKIALQFCPEPVSRSFEAPLKVPPTTLETAEDLLGLFSLFLTHRLKDRFGEDWKCRVLKFWIVHVTGHNLVVLTHPLDHELFDKPANAELELIEWVGQRVCMT